MKQFLQVIYLIIPFLINRVGYILVLISYLLAGEWDCAAEAFYKIFSWRW